MTYLISHLPFILALVIFSSAVFMHLSKKNALCILFFAVQSLAVSLLLIIPALEEGSLLLMVAALLTLLIKAIVAPFFFLKLIKRHDLVFSVSSYFGLPLILIILAALTGLAYGDVFHSLALLGGENAGAIPLSLSVIFISIFLTVNRRGALSQIIGILSLENGIMALVTLLGVGQTPGLDIGVSFDIAVWVVIATLFLSMIHKQFGTLDASIMKHLKEE